MSRKTNQPASPTWIQDNQKTQLLIVDDEPNIRYSLVRALSLLGHVVEEAESGREALALLEQSSPDLMLLDMHMPGMDGMEVMERARQMHPELLIIILTGYASVENAIAAVKSDVIDYLRKPASMIEITQAVTQALEKRAQYHQQQQLVQFLQQALAALHQSDAFALIPTPLIPDLTSPPLELRAYPENLIHAHPLMLVRQKRLVTFVNDTTRLIQLTKGESVVLASLMAHSNQALSCEQLVFIAWSEQMEEARALSLVRPYIFRLRRKLEDDPKNPCLIRTIRRYGYVFGYCS